MWASIRVEIDMVNASEFKVAQRGNVTIDVGRYTHGFKTLDITESAGPAKLTIGSYTSIDAGASVVLGAIYRPDCIANFPFGHVFQQELGSHGVEVANTTEGNVTIGNDVWIGANATIMPGVTIGDGAVIAANATVFQDIGNYEIWAGNPATFVKKRFDDEVCAKLMQLKWWNLPEVLLREMAPLLASQPSVELIDSLQSIVDDLVSFEAA